MKNPSNYQKPERNCQHLPLLITKIIIILKKKNKTNKILRVFVTHFFCPRMFLFLLVLYLFRLVIIFYLLPSVFHSLSRILFFKKNKFECVYFLTKHTYISHTPSIPPLPPCVLAHPSLSVSRLFL